MCGENESGRMTTRLGGAREKRIIETRRQRTFSSTRVLKSKRRKEEAGIIEPETKSLLRIKLTHYICPPLLSP